MRRCDLKQCGMRCLMRSSMYIVYMVYIYILYLCIHSIHKSKGSLFARTWPKRSYPGNRRMCVDRQLKSVDAQTKDMTLKPENEWKVEPNSRYRHM